MKTYNLNVQEKEFSFGKMNVVTLGEDGRGRKYTYVPCEITNTDTTAELAQTRKGGIKIVSGTKNQNWLARISSNGTYTRGTYGSVYCQVHDKDKIKVNAYGYGAYGAAGRIGQYYDFLLTIPDGTFIKVRPSGGSHKIARYWLYFDFDKVYKINEEEMELFCEHRRLTQPAENFDELYDLALFIKSN